VEAITRKEKESKMKINRSDLVAAFDLLGVKNVRTITWFINNYTGRIRISKRVYRFGVMSRDSELVVTIGKPNSKERAYLKRPDHKRFIIQLLPINKRRVR
jgi:hypothetical protein